MALMDILATAHGGAYFANAGKAAGLDAAAARVSIERLAPEIAERLRKHAEDDQAYEALLDLLEDGDGDAFLDDASLMGDKEVASDGKAVLKDLYGSLAAASKAGTSLTGLPKAQIDRLMPLTAASVLAAVVRANSGPQHLAATGGGSGGGLLGNIVSAVIEGAIKGATSTLAPKRRRKRYVSYSSRRRRTTTKRRTRKPSLESIFREILLGR
jgi:hypothetical protein